MSGELVSTMLFIFFFNFFCSLALDAIGTEKHLGMNFSDLRSALDVS